MAAVITHESEAKLELFLQWLQVCIHLFPPPLAFKVFCQRLKSNQKGISLQANRAELRGCSIKHCGPHKGFGIYTNENTLDNDVVMVVPLDLAITPMRVLQDPLLGSRCRELFQEGEVDDRFLVMLFLTVERLRHDSPWKPYLDMLPRSFGNPLWFTETELAELKGTTLYRASMQQKKNLEALYEGKAKRLIEEFLQCDGKSKGVKDLRFEDFLWANSVFWTRALNIPFPHYYVFPDTSEGQSNSSTNGSHNPDDSSTQELGENSKNTDIEAANVVNKTENGSLSSTKKGAEIVWVEGLVPGIDFCNHALKAAATWEVDSKGHVTGVPNSMYLILAEKGTGETGKEINISYGNKGNEELLYLYGFCIDNNSDDFVMLHYPAEAIPKLPFSDTKAKLLEIQNAELRCLLPKSLLDNGIFASHQIVDENNKEEPNFQQHSYSWSGQRKVPCYLNKLVFPHEFLTALRTIAMQEDEIDQVYSLLKELVGSDEERQPNDKEIQAAIWEICGDKGALQLLVDLLQMKMTELEEGSETQDSDTRMLENCHVVELEDNFSEGRDEKEGMMARNRWSSIVYRRGQKQLTELFLKEAEHLLEMCLIEQQ